MDGGELTCSRRGVASLKFAQIKIIMIIQKKELIHSSFFPLR